MAFPLFVDERVADYWLYIGQLLLMACMLAVLVVRLPLRRARARVNGTSTLPLTGYHDDLKLEPPPRRVMFRLIHVACCLAEAGIYVALLAEGYQPA